MFKKLFLLTLSLVFLTSCGRNEQAGKSSGADKTSLQIMGSDTMVNLGQAWAEGFMKKYPDAFVAVTGGGSGTGIAALLNGTCDIAETSRKIKAKEIELARQKGIEPVEFTVAFDGLAVVVHRDNPVEQLTVTQLAEIFTGKIKNWKEVGGTNTPIVLLSREVNSGTHVYFKEHVLRHSGSSSTAEFSEEALLMPSSQAIADEIAQNPNAIGYYGMGYLNPTQKAAAVAKDKQSGFYLPTTENVMRGHYYISRPLLMNTNGQPQGLVKKFLDFVFSAEGQGIVKEIDFVPLP